MIKPDRLKELIEQEATIWYANITCITEKILDNTYKVDSAYLWKKIKSGAVKSCGYPLENLFETKEEAEWYLEFGNITREEKLSLPSWEELEKDLDKRNGDFWIVDNNYFTFIYDKRDFSSQLKLRTIDENYDWNATKENYIDACKLCRSLFLGESYGDK